MTGQWHGRRRAGTREGSDSGDTTKPSSAGQWAGGILPSLYFYPTLPLPPSMFSMHGMHAACTCCIALLAAWWQCHVRGQGRQHGLFETHDSSGTATQLWTNRHDNSVVSMRKHHDKTEQLPGLHNMPSFWDIFRTGQDGLFVFKLLRTYAMGSGKVDVVGMGLAFVPAASVPACTHFAACNIYSSALLRWHLADSLLPTPNFCFSWQTSLFPFQCFLVLFLPNMCVPRPSLPPLSSLSYTLYSIPHFPPRRINFF